MTPLERAARALYARAPLEERTPLPDRKLGMGFVPWDEAPKHQRDHFMNHARAVFEAIRDPDDQMIAALWPGEPDYFAGKVVPLRKMAVEGWRMIIDAALSEGNAK